MKNGGRLNFFVKLTIIAVICFCVVNILKLRSDYNDLKIKEKDLIAEKEKYMDAIEQLRSELEHPMDNEYIMRVAREKLGYYLPDEIIFYNDHSR